MPVVRRAFFARRAAVSPVCATGDAEICAGPCSDCVLAATTATTTSATLRAPELNCTPPGALATGQATGKEGASVSELVSVGDNHADRARRTGRQNAGPTRQDLEMIDRTRAAR